eukprot:TCALIF_11619-PA protein Name:"Similar to TOLLIP Toll-interacting protein (Homo sapiens)" AED:0.09 eAED:0.09 QI:0/0/0/0.5/1/1/2/0/331
MDEREASICRPEVGNLVDVGPSGAALGATPRAQGPVSGFEAGPAVARSEAGSTPSTRPPLSQSQNPAPNPPMSTEEQDRAMAIALQEQMNMEDNEAFAAHQAGSGFYSAGQVVVAPANMLGKLTVTVVEAKLAKNYGIARMDPYCRLRVGHSVFESPTCPNGSKEPKWNKTFHSYLLQGIKHMEIEIYDECTFQQDALIATGTFPIPDTVLKNHEVVDEWLPLSGNEGPDKEGIIHVIMSLQPIQPGQSLGAAVRTAPNVAAGHKPMTYQTVPNSSQPAPVRRPPTLSNEELDEFVKMFPNLDQDIIASVFASSQGDKEVTVNNLLQLSQS